MQNIGQKKKLCDEKKKSAKMASGNAFKKRDYHL